MINSVKMLLSLLTLSLFISVVHAKDFKFDEPKQNVLVGDYELPNLVGTSEVVPKPGKLTLINFWATFCGPCRQEMPSLNRLWDKYKEHGLEIQAVALDGDRKVAIEKFMQRYNLNLPVLLDEDSGISRDYKVSMMPVTYLISPNGEVLGRAVGERDWASEAAFQLIESHLP